MVGTGSGVAAPEAVPSAVAEGRTTVVARAADTALDLVVVLLATWTLVYHLALLVRLPADLALVVEALLLAGLGVRYRAGRAARAARSEPVEPVAPPEPEPAAGRSSVRPAVVAVVAASLATLAMATDLPWVLVWVPWLVAALAGAVTAWSALGPGPVPRAARPYDDAVAVAWALALAAFSTFTLRPNPDDLYYVNLSQWVAEHGSFPLRDTIFSDLDFPMSSWPPLASYDGLTGTLAHVAGLPAGDIVYVVVTPLATFLAVLALWRLLRAWRVPSLTLALSAAMVFLLLDGTSAYGPPGNLFLTRLWQGKVILLCVLVPTLLVYALRYVEGPSRRRLAWLGAGGVAAVGLSTTAIFLVPVVAAAGMAPLLRRSRRRAAEGFAAMAAYPLVAGAVTLAVGGRSADDFAGRRLYRFDPQWFGHTVFLTGFVALLAVLAVLLGALLVPHRAARLTTALLVVATGITFVPGLTRLVYATVGLGPTLWRISWGCTIAALVGVLVVRLVGCLPRPVRVVGVVGLLAVLVATGSPIWAPDTSTRLVAPFHWQRGDETRAVVAWMQAHTEPGAVVLGPDGLAITVAVSTTEIKTVAPRDYFLSYLRDDPRFDFAQRLDLVRLANGTPTAATSGTIDGDLDTLDVAVACVYRDDVVGAATIEQAGYAVALRTSTYTCLTPGT